MAAVFADATVVYGPAVGVHYIMELRIETVAQCLHFFSQICVSGDSRHQMTRLLAWPFACLSQVDRHLLHPSLFLYLCLCLSPYLCLYLYSCRENFVNYPDRHLQRPFVPLLQDLVVSFSVSHLELWV